MWVPFPLVFGAPTMNDVAIPTQKKRTLHTLWVVVVIGSEKFACIKDNRTAV